MASYQDLLSRASGVASTPYQSYGGQLVAPVNQQQYLGIGNINQYAQAAQPYIGAAAHYAGEGAAPITGADIAGFQSPYTQQVVNATEAQFNQQNAQQLQGVKGNAIAQGALGGDREAIAEATTAGQQQMAEAPVIAGLYNQGFTQASQMAMAEKQRQAEAGYQFGALGTEAENAGLTGANAQVGAGTLEQQTQQAQNQAAYGQFQIAQAFPYMQSQWLAGIDTGVGSQMGGTSQTTAPAPSMLPSIAGLGLSAAALFGARGGRVPGFDLGGNVPGGDVGTGVGNAGGSYPLFGGGYGTPPMPYAGGHGFIPGVGIVYGHGAPPPPNPPGAQQQPGASDMMKAASAIASRHKNAGVAPQGPVDSATGSFAPEAGFGSIVPDGMEEPLDVSGSNGAIYRRGGYVPVISGFGTGGIILPRYADGGDVDAAFSALRDQSKGADTGGNAYGLQPNTALTYSDLMEHAIRHYRPDSREMGFATPRGLVTGRGYADGGTPQGFEEIDASDLPPISADRLGLGQPVDWGDRGRMPEMLAQRNFDMAQGAYGGPPASGGTPGVGSSLPPEITQGTSRPASAGPDTGSALPFDAEGSRGVGAPMATSSNGVAAPSGGEEGSGFFHLSPAARSGLLAAGLGMMANRSPYPMVGIGEGGLRGMEAYSAQKQQEMAGRKVDLEAQRLDQLAEQAQKHLQLQTRQAQETERYHTGELGLRKQQLEQENWGVTTDNYGKPIWYNKKTGEIRQQNPLGASGSEPSLSPGPQAPKTQGADAETPKPVQVASIEPSVFTDGGNFTGKEKFADDVNPDALNEFARQNGMNDAQKAQAIAIAEGRRPILPTGRNNPANRMLMDAAYTYRPGMDASDYGRRQRTQNFFAVGTQGGGGQNIAAMNTFGQHLGVYLNLMDQMDRGGLTDLNSIKNFMNDHGFLNWTSTGKVDQDRLRALDVVRKGMSDEGAKVFAGTGSALEDRREWENKFAREISTSSAHSAAATAVTMIGGRLNSLSAQYNSGMRTNHAPVEFIRPETREVFDKALKWDSSQAPAAASPQAPASQAPAQPPGRVRQNGHTYERQGDGSYKAVD